MTNYYIGILKSMNLPIHQAASQPSLPRDKDGNHVFRPEEAADANRTYNFLFFLRCCAARAVRLGLTLEQYHHLIIIKEITPPMPHNPFIYEHVGALEAILKSTEKWNDDLGEWILKD